MLPWGSLSTRAFCVTDEWSRTHQQSICCFSLLNNYMFDVHDVDTDGGVQTSWLQCDIENTAYHSIRHWVLHMVWLRLSGWSSQYVTFQLDFQRPLSWHSSTVHSVLAVLQFNVTIYCNNQLWYFSSCPQIIACKKMRRCHCYCNSSRCWLLAQLILVKYQLETCRNIAKICCCISDTSSCFDNKLSPAAGGQDNKFGL